MKKKKIFNFYMQKKALKITIFDYGHGNLCLYCLRGGFTKVCLKMVLQP